MTSRQTTRTERHSITRPPSRRLRIVVLAGFLIAGALGAGGAVAQADSLQGGCTGWVAGACVQGTMGGKNVDNKTQWIGWVTAKAWGNISGVKKLEAWGDGFYFSTSVNTSTVNPSKQWGAQRWVKSGTNVCGAITYSSGSRDIACIYIKV